MDLRHRIETHTAKERDGEDEIVDRYSDGRSAVEQLKWHDGLRGPFQLYRQEHHKEPGRRPEQTEDDRRRPLVCGD